MTIEYASIARPQLGSPSPTVPNHVLEAQRAYRNGELTLAQAQRRIAGGHKTRTKIPAAKMPTAESKRRKVALDGLRKRLEYFETLG